MSAHGQVRPGLPYPEPQSSSPLPMFPASIPIVIPNIYAQTKSAESEQPSGVTTYEGSAGGVARG